jgi:transposase
MKKKLHNDSYRTVNNRNCIRIENGTISLPKVGNVPIRFHRKLPGQIKTVTVSYHHGYREVSIPVEADRKAAKTELKTKAGFDINSRQTLVSSNGWYVTNPRYLSQTRKKIQQVQCRDWNSAINIEQIGLKELTQAGTVCWALPTAQQKVSDKTKVRSLLRLDAGSVQSSAA